MNDAVNVSVSVTCMSACASASLVTFNRRQVNEDSFKHLLRIAYFQKLKTTKHVHHVTSNVCGVGFSMFSPSRAAAAAQTGGRTRCGAQQREERQDNHTGQSVETNDCCSSSSKRDSIGQKSAVPPT